MLPIYTGRWEHYCHRGQESAITGSSTVQFLLKTNVANHMYFTIQAYTWILA